MEKIKITSTESIFIDRKLPDVSYKLKMYLALEDKLKIAETYLDSIFSKEGVALAYLTAEYSLMLSVVDYCTNIDINDEDILNKLIFLGIWDDIRQNIKNYEEFRKELESIVAGKRMEISLESNINALVMRAYDFIEGISQLDFSENGMKQLSENFGELSKNVDSLKNGFFDEPEKKRRGRPKKIE